MACGLKYFLRSAKKGNCLHMTKSEKGQRRGSDTMVWDGLNDFTCTFVGRRRQDRPPFRIAPGAVFLNQRAESDDDHTGILIPNQAECQLLECVRRESAYERDSFFASPSS